MKKILSILFLAFLVAFSVPSLAQDYIDGDAGGDGARLEKIERDLQMLQRQVARSPRSTNGGGGSVSADFEVRLSGFEDQIRTLSGKLEEAEFKNKKLNETLEKFQRDVDFRFNELAKSSPVTNQVTPAVKNDKTEKTDKTKPTAKASDSTEESEHAAEGNPDTDSDLQSDFGTPREHYNYAFRLLNQNQYDKAAASLTDFIKKYPQDSLVGNAYYWLGETFYIRRDYVAAADNFRQGFEALPAGSKAADNLLKLAMSLNSLKRDKEACVVLEQIITKFKKTAATVSQKAEREQKRISCGE